MTTKLSFRARALDAVKPMPIYIQEDVPDLKDLATINRTVPEMPTGMEKEEETVKTECLMYVARFLAVKDILCLLPLSSVIAFDICSENEDEKCYC